MSNLIQDQLTDILMDTVAWNVHYAGHGNRYGQYAHSCRFCKQAQENLRVELIAEDPNAYDADAGREQEAV